MSIQRQAAKSGAGWRRGYITHTPLQPGAAAAHPSGENLRRLAASR
jgi:hypothetical protein